MVSAHNEPKRAGLSLSCTFQADSSRDLDAVEVFKLEHYVAVVRREYVESYESRNPPSVTRTQLKKALTERGNAPFTTHHKLQCKNPREPLPPVKLQNGGYVG